MFRSSFHLSLLVTIIAFLYIDNVNSQDVCTDITSQCEHWADIDYCTRPSKFQGFMLLFCCQSCSIIIARSPKAVEIAKPITEQRDCKDYFDEGYTEDGVYTITPDSTAVDVYCDMQNGGWTVFQQRFNGSTDFRRDFEAYATGFGDLNAEFWLGLDVLHSLTAPGQTWQLRIDLTSDRYGETHSLYNQFSVGAAPGYMLSVGNFQADSSTAGDSFSDANGHNFSTPDKDQDNNDERNCADKYRDGAWWYEGLPTCYYSYANLNAFQYGAIDGIQKRVFWYINHGLKFISGTKMMIRRL